MSGKIYVAGHAGMVGSAVLRLLQARGTPTVTRPRAQLDLTDRQAVRAFLSEERPEAMVIAAARVGGIQANDSYPADFIHDNLAIQTNLIGEAFRAGIRRLVFLGSSCIYPREAPQPMREDALLTGPLEPTNEPYAIAKIAGIKLCESYNRQHGTDYRSVMPTNLYGPGDNFHPEKAHVLPALIRRFHEAREAGLDEVVVWGTGTPRREFLHVDDMAAAVLFVLDLPEATYRAATLPMRSHINIGCGEDITIAALAHLVAEVVGYEGRIRFDPGRPDGTPRKLLDIALLQSLGWRPSIALEAGLRQSYAWFLEHRGDIRSV